MQEERAQRYETFISWYLRFNGYFTVPSFVVHAGDDASRISGEVVSSHTEVDTVAIRLPYSREESGTRFPVDERLVKDAEGRFDLVLAEVKSGQSASPNKIWQNGQTFHIEYILRFIGWHKDEDEIVRVAKVLSERYSFEEGCFRARYIVFAQRVNPTWSGRGVPYVTFDDCIRFISEERGQCWASSGICRRSMHSQWDPLLRRVFDIANNASLDSPSRQKQIRQVLDGG